MINIIADYVTKHADIYLTQEHGLFTIIIESNDRNKIERIQIKCKTLNLIDARPDNKLASQSITNMINNIAAIDDNLEENNSPITKEIKAPIKDKWGDL